MKQEMVDVFVVLGLAIVFIPFWLWWGKREADWEAWSELQAREQALRHMEALDEAHETAAMYLGQTNEEYQASMKRARGVGTGTPHP